jgi:hypothetical protein
MNGRNMTSEQGRKSLTQALTLKGQLQNNKDDTVTLFIIKISEDRDQPRDIGEIISTFSGMHLYILFVSLS